MNYYSFVIFIMSEIIVFYFILVLKCWEHDTSTHYIFAGTYKVPGHNPHRVHHALSELGGHHKHSRRVELHIARSKDSHTLKVKFYYYYYYNYYIYFFLEVKFNYIDSWSIFSYLSLRKLAYVMYRDF